MSFRKLIPACLLVLALPSPASAKVGSRNLEFALKTHQFCALVDYPESATVVQGENGVLANIILAAYVDDGAQTQTSSIVQPITPMKLRVEIEDDGGATTPALTCSVQIFGLDQFGGAISETVSASETAATTVNVYSKITKISTVAGACVAAADTSDYLLVNQSLQIGLGRKIGATSDVVMACFVDDPDGTADTKCSPYDIGTDDSISDIVSVSTHSIDFSVTAFGPVGGSEVAATDGDILCVRVVPSL